MEEQVVKDRRTGRGFKTIGRKVSLGKIVKTPDIHNASFTCRRCLHGLLDQSFVRKDRFSLVLMKSRQIDRRGEWGKMRAQTLVIAPSSLSGLPGPLDLCRVRKPQKAALADRKKVNVLIVIMKAVCLLCVEVISSDIGISHNRLGVVSSFGRQ